MYFPNLPLPLAEELEREMQELDASNLGVDAASAPMEGQDDGCHVPTSRFDSGDHDTTKSPNDVDVPSHDSMTTGVATNGGSDDDPRESQVPPVELSTTEQPLEPNSPVSYRMGGCSDDGYGGYGTPSTPGTDFENLGDDCLELFLAAHLVGSAGVP